MELGKVITVIVVSIIGFIGLSIIFHEEAIYILGRIGTFQKNRKREKEILDYTNTNNNYTNIDYTKRTRGVTTT